MTEAAFAQFTAGVLAGVSAPLNPITEDVIWGWANAESDPYDVMHINNPLDSTWGMPGAVPWNTFGDNEHVWIYASVQDGITATVNTLLDGRYPTILANLRSSLPRSEWGNACKELGVWGTGCSWLNTNYGLAPQSAGEEMTASMKMALVQLAYHAGFDRSASTAELSTWVSQIADDGSNINLILSQILSSAEAVQHQAAEEAALKASGTPAPDDDSQYATKDYVNSQVQTALSNLPVPAHKHSIVGPFETSEPVAG